MDTETFLPDSQPFSVEEEEYHNNQNENIDTDTCLPDSQPFFVEEEKSHNDQNENIGESQKRKLGDSDAALSQSLLPSLKLRRNSMVTLNDKNTSASLQHENSPVLNSNKEELNNTHHSDFESEQLNLNNTSSSKCNLCVFEKELDKRNYYFGNLLIGELQFLHPCMRSDAYINILTYVDSLKQKHRN